MSEQKAVRITSDGSLRGSRVVDVEGNEIPMVTRIQFDITPGAVPRAEIDVVMPQVDVVAGASIHARCPYCGREDDS